MNDCLICNILTKLFNKNTTIITDFPEKKTTIKNYLMLNNNVNVK